MRARISYKLNGMGLETNTNRIGGVNFNGRWELRITRLHGQLPNKKIHNPAFTLPAIYFLLWFTGSP